jgi:uncharacterized coiled-coil protein SlyX
MMEMRKKDLEREAANAERLSELSGIVLSQSAYIADLQAQIETLKAQLKEPPDPQE